MGPLLAAAVRIRLGRGGGEVFAIIGGLVVTAIVIGLIVGPKAQPMTDPRTGLERQTLPVAPNLARIWGCRVAAGLFAAVGLWLLVGSYAEQTGYRISQMGIPTALCFGAATIAAYIGDVRLPGIIAGGVAGLLLMAKPVLFPIMSRGWDDPTQMHPFSLTSETHLMFIVPGALLCVLAALFLLRLWRQGSSGAPVR